MVKKSKKKSKVKDANAPKQPLNAYFFFLKEKRPEFKTKHPKLKPQELVKALHKQWIELEINEKEKYQNLANDDRERYKLAKNKK